MKIKYRKLSAGELFLDIIRSNRSELDVIIVEGLNRYYMRLDKEGLNSENTYSTKTIKGIKTNYGWRLNDKLFART